MPISWVLEMMMNSPVLRFAVITSLMLCSGSARARVGADMPWTTYEAEDMNTTGTVLGPKYDPFLLETESSHQKCVKLVAAGEYVEFTAQADASAIVVRYSLPDSPGGGGLNSTLGLYQNGKLVKQLPITSRYSWLYGKYPFSNDPQEAKPRNFYDEVRSKDLAVAKGDVIRLQHPDKGAPYCIIDLVDLEEVAPPRVAPENSLSVIRFGADATGKADATEALRKCITEAGKQGRTVWVPPGVYTLTGDIILASDVTIQGAGMWHTTFIGDADLYGRADHRVRFKLTGRNIHLADFAITGKLNYRNDQEPNDGIVGARGRDSTLTRIWVEHTKAGMWFYNGSNLLLDSCRFRNVLADGMNFCVDTRNSVVENCTARGTGDDCFAIWPAPSDQGYVQAAPMPGSNVIRRCTGQLPFLANGASVYGGRNNRVEDCLFTDISTGCGVLISTTFPTADESRGIDNNFSGTTLVQNCDLIRCGGYDHGWTWRGALQLCMHGRSISGLVLRNVTIRDSFSHGLTVVGPETGPHRGSMSDVRLEDVHIPNHGIGTESSHGLWIRDDARGSLSLVDSDIVDIHNSSTNFTVLKE